MKDRYKLNSLTTGNRHPLLGSIMRSTFSFRAVVLLAGLGITFAMSSMLFAQEKKPAEQDDVVRVKTDLIQTGVTVLDKQGRFVDGLRREQFELRLEDKPQSISFFEQVRTGSKREERALAEAVGQTESGSSSAGVRRGRTIIFFLDDLHLSLGSLDVTRDTLLRFIDKEMTQDDLVAIASPSGRVGFLQQFTDNKTVLRAAVARLSYIPYNTLEMKRESTPMTEFLALTIDRKDDPRAFKFYVDECLKAAPPRYPVTACEVEVVNRARQILVQAASVISNTYDSLKSLMRSSSQLPGRKLVFFISDGFLLDTGRHSSDPRYKLKEITDAAHRAGVVIYTVDARGLVSGLLDATNSVPFDPNGRLENATLREIPATQDAMNALASDTGGRALRNQNDFDSWINRSLDETSNYYLLAWRPENEDQPTNQFRNVTVSVVGHPEFSVRVARGFFAATPVATKPPPTVKTPPQPLQAALTAFYPKREVSVALSTTYLDTPEHGIVLTASTQVADDALTFETVDGKQTAIVDVAGIVLNDKGKSAGSFQTRLNITGAASDRADTIYNYRAPLLPGLYQVRVAARDSKSGHVGSAIEWIEIPDLKLQRLTLSSLLIGVENVGPTSQVQFSVDNRVRSSLPLRFLSFVYNAPPAAQGLKVQAEIMRNGRTVMTAQLPDVGIPTNDRTRLPYAGEIKLNSVPSGSYTLQITVTDPTTKATASQQTDIVID